MRNSSIAAVRPITPFTPSFCSFAEKGKTGKTKLLYGTHQLFGARVILTLIHCHRGPGVIMAFCHLHDRLEFLTTEYVDVA